VVSVGVSQDDGVKLARLKRELIPVQIAQQLGSLKQSAIDQNLGFANAQKML
jgi:hypothetical protein